MGYIIEKIAYKNNKKCSKLFEFETLFARVDYFLNRIFLAGMVKMPILCDNFHSEGIEYQTATRCTNCMNSSELF